MHRIALHIFVLAVLAVAGSAQIAPIGTQGSYPDIQADTSGDLHLVYARSGKTYYRFIKPAIGYIGPEEDTGCPASSDHRYQPDVAVDSKGDVHVIGGQRYNKRTGGSWGLPENPSLSRDHHMTVDSNDNVWVVYRGQYLVVKQKIAGKSSWESGKTLFNEGDTSHVYPDIAAGTDGSVHIVFRARGAPYMNQYDCGYLKYDGNTWGAAEWACNNDFAKVMEGPHVALDSGNVPFVSWPDGSARVATRQANGTWTRFKNLSYSGEREEPTIGIDDQDNMVVGWFDGRYAAYDKTKNQWTNGTIQPVNGNNSVGFVDVVGAASGCYVVWEEGTTVDKSVGAGAVDLVVAKIMPDGSVVSLATEKKSLLEIVTPTISAASGGTLTFDISTSPAQAGRYYLMVAGLTGTAPGTPLVTPAVLPINLDAMSILVFQLTVVPQSMFADFYNPLDQYGCKRVTAPIPAGLLPAFVGANFYFASFLFPADFVTNPVVMKVTP